MGKGERETHTHKHSARCCSGNNMQRMHEQENFKIDMKLG